MIDINDYYIARVRKIGRGGVVQSERTLDRNGAQTGYREWAPGDEPTEQELDK
jgi:hypothetical protein